MELVPTLFQFFLLSTWFLTFVHAVAFGGIKVLNKVGDLLTIAHEIWELSWDPDCRRTTLDPVTFGKNRRTGYSGLVRVRAISRLEPEELEGWKRSNLFPPGPKYFQPRASYFPVLPVHCSPEACYCKENIDPVAEFKHSRPTLGWPSRSGMVSCCTPVASRR